jgi:hypothetical protein
VSFRTKAGPLAALFWRHSCPLSLYFGNPLGGHAEIKKAPRRREFGRRVERFFRTAETGDAEDEIGATAQRLDSCNIAIAWSDNGTTCAELFFTRSFGRLHVRASRSISLHFISETSRNRWQVRANILMTSP